MGLCSRSGGMKCIQSPTFWINFWTRWYHTFSTASDVSAGYFLQIAYLTLAGQRGRNLRFAWVLSKGSAHFYLSVQFSTYWKLIYCLAYLRDMTNSDGADPPDYSACHGKSGWICICLQPMPQPGRRLFSKYDIVRDELHRTVIASCSLPGFASHL